MAIVRRMGLSEFFNRVKGMPAPSTESLLQALSMIEERRYEATAEVKDSGAISAVLPDLTAPLSTVSVEAGAAAVEGFGRAKVKFKSEFSDTPAVLAVPFGCLELRVPWITIEWRQITIGWWTINLPVPAVTTMTIYLPSMCFLMGIEKDGFTVFNVLGRTVICYLAFGG